MSIPGQNKGKTPVTANRGLLFKDLKQIYFLGIGRIEGPFLIESTTFLQANTITVLLTGLSRTVLNTSGK